MASTAARSAKASRLLVKASLSQNGSFGSHAAARYVAATTQACCDAVMESAGKGGAEGAVAKSTIAFAANGTANDAKRPRLQ